MTLFLTGPLRHVPLLACVLGRDLGAGDLVAARLDQAQLTQHPGRHVPVLTLGVGGRVDGVILMDCSDEEQAKISFYLGGLGGDVVEVETSKGPAKAFVGEAEEQGSLFDFEAWRANEADVAVETAREAMRHFGRLTPEGLAGVLHGMRLRASARVRAREGAFFGFDGEVSYLSRDLAYTDFFAVEDIMLQASTFEGGESGPLKRAVFLGMDAAIVLPYDPVNDQVLLVEQLRLGPIGRDDPDRWLLEPVAGHVDPGETPEEAAHREGAEEAGVTFERLELVSQSYASPGATTDFFYIYVGLCDLSEVREGVAGVEAEGENIRTHHLSFDAFMEFIEGPRCRVVPLALAGHWLARHRDRLRGS